MSAISSPPPTNVAAPRRVGWSRITDYLGMLVSLAVLVLIFGSLSERFLNPRTLTSIANQIPDLTVVAVGMTLVLIVGGIDLSVGSVLALSAGVLGAALVDGHWPLWLAMVACLTVGTLCGTISGVISVGAAIPSFIVTLGMLEIARGGAYLVTDSQTKYIGAAIVPISTPLPGLHVSLAFLLAVAIVIAGQIIISRTVFGRYCIAIGTNDAAVRMSGIDPRPYRIIVFGVSGFLCGLGGIMHTARLASADPNAAMGMELAAIAAAVIGGTSLSGGRGSVVNTFFGVLIIAVLQTGLAQIGAAEPVKRVVTGGVIVLAVLLDAYRNRIHGGLKKILASIFDRYS